MKSEMYDFLIKALNLVGLLEMFAGAIWFGICLTSPEKTSELLGVGLFTSGMFTAALGQIMVALSRIVEKINPKEEE
jgi:hypothetical protein